MARELDRRIQPVVIENARIIFRNFAGLEGQYNRAGDRNFGVVLEDPAIVEQLVRDGWNVKYLKPREEGDEPQPWIQVSVSYKGRPPTIVLITHRGDKKVRTTLPEDMIELVDYADISFCDLILNPYQWNVNGNTGVKAYLKSLFVTISQDELERKYADIEELDARSGAPLEIAATPHEDDEIYLEEQEDGVFG